MTSLDVGALELPRWRVSGGYLGRLAAFGCAWLLALVSLGVALIGHGGEADAMAYYLSGHGPIYVAGANLNSANYLYPPPFAQLTYPLTQLPWQAFAVVWTVGIFAAFVWLLRPVSLRLRLPLLIAVMPLALLGNVEPFVGIAIVAAMRYPAAWAFVVLTKVTPGVGVVWHAVRREWRSLGIAIAATAAVALVSLALAPDLWPAWIGTMLADSAHHSGITFPPFLPALPVRIVLAGLIAAWGAWSDRRWTLALAVLVANPDILAVTFGVLAAVPRLTRRVGSESSLAMSEPRASRPSSRRRAI